MQNAITSYEELLDLLRKDGVLHQADLEERSVTIPTGRGELRGVLVIRWQADQGVMQLVQSLPFKVPDEQHAAYESALARINHALLIPGFGYNHEAGTPYYRLAMPIFPGRPPRAEDVRAAFRTAVKTAADFLPSLRRVATEGANPDTIVADARVDLALGEGA